MSEVYEEWIEGERMLRLPPGPRHEDICARLTRRVEDAVCSLPSTLLLERRAPIEVSPGNVIRPDLALVTAATHKLWLVAEVVSANDHFADTVAKKSLFQDIKLPRLWMIDPRYDNVEVYYGSPYGIVLKQILAGRELLEEPLLPGFRFAMHELFGGKVGGPGDGLSF